MNGLKDWLLTADRGDRVVYHTGMLVSDRHPPQKHREIDGVGTMAWEAYRAGTVSLVQRRTPDGSAFEYIAERR